MNAPLPADEAGRLARLHECRILDTATEAVFDDLTLLASQICGTPIALVSFTDADRQWIKAKVGMNASEMPRDIALCAHAILKPDILVVPDTTLDERFADNPVVTGEPHVRFYAGAPLITSDGYALGTLCVIDSVPRRLTEAQLQALRALARQVVTQVEARREVERSVIVEQQLRQSKKRFRDVVDQAADIIYRTDVRGRFTLVNPTFERVLGYTDAAARDMRYVDVIAPRHARAAVRFYTRQLLSGTPTSYYELQIKTRENTELWLGQNVQLLFDNDQPVGFQAVARDITERRAEKEALRVSQARYDRIAANMPGMVYQFERRVDGTFRFPFVSDGCLAIYGLTAAELIADPHALVRTTHPEDRRDFLRTIAESAGTLAPWRWEGRIIRPSGEIRWVECASRPETQPDGSIIWDGLVMDVTERRHTEQRLRESEAALRQSEQYRDLFRLASDPILVVDTTDDVVLDVNDRACEAYGLLRAEFIGRSFIPLSREPARDAEHMRRLFAIGSHDEYETTHLRRDGKTLDFHVSASLIEYDGRRAVLCINRDIGARLRAEHQLRHDAFHDRLTGLPNRALFEDHLALALGRAQRDSHRLFAVLFLELDRFKVINDSLGHALGDRLLILIARRIKSVLRPGDSVARLGGDEYTILLDGLDDEGDALRVAERIQSDLRAPFDLRGNEVYTSASIGIAFSHLRYAHPGELIRDADTAMYRAKAQGKARHEVFDQAMYRYAIQRLQLETELRHAVEREDFEIHYQPIVRIADERIVGFEALVRWRHAERGLIPPIDFIPLAEETGMILALGQQVLREACRQMRRWQQSHAAHADLTVSVNLSCKQFVQADLAAKIADVLAETKLDARSLKLELTESVLMEHDETAVATLNRLRAIGVEISIDDFGTGYSSLAYLHRLPIDILKIDRSFVASMNDSPEKHEITRTVISLAHNLGMRTIAEGVETRGQIERLLALDCEYAQGYLFSRPVPAAGVDSLLARLMEVSSTLTHDAHKTAAGNSVVSHDLVG